MSVPEATVLHAGAVAMGEGCVLLCGPAGSGKSSLALSLLGFGGTLVADDRTVLTREGDRLIASAPPGIAGLIEARGIGLLRVATVAARPVTLVVDLGEAEAERLPPRRTRALSGVALPLIHGRDLPHLAPAVALMLQGAIRLDPDA